MARRHAGPWQVDRPVTRLRGDGRVQTVSSVCQTSPVKGLAPPLMLMLPSAVSQTLLLTTTRLQLQLAASQLMAL